jgi:hypothetical protein
MGRHRDYMHKIIFGNNTLFRNKPKTTREQNMANFEEIKQGINDDILNYSNYAV